MSSLRPLSLPFLSLLLLILVACGGTDPANPEPAVTDPTAVSSEPIDLPDTPTAVPPEPEVVPTEPEAIPPTEPTPTIEPTTAVPSSA
ncbi:MAG: hypothetical protein KDD89_11940, partial [Anaerolineales bacterium]|nr:hypothetical protein [Anaerolineales bacterium]